MKKRIVQIILAVCLLLPLLTATGLAEPEETSGSWENGPSWSYDESSNTLTISGTGDIPDATDTNPAPYDKDIIENLVIESGVTGVGQKAFYNCAKLAAIEVKGSIGNIGDYAFADCDQLSSIVFRGDVGDIGNNAFSGCGNFVTLQFLGDVGNIGDNAFSGCALSDPQFEGSVGSIGENAFQNCGFHRITFPHGVGDIQYHAFYQCRDLTAICILTPDEATVGKIDSGAFYGTPIRDIYYGGTEDTWKSTGFEPYRGYPIIHYGSASLPEIEAGNATDLQRLIDAGAGAGLTEIVLTGTITADTPLRVGKTCDVRIDLNGHSITSTADPVFEIEGKLAVMDSTLAWDSKPVIDESNHVTYTSNSISGSGTVMEVKENGSFELNCGTVRSSNGTAISLSGNSSFASIRGGYVEAGGIAVSASGNQASVDVTAAVILSDGNAIISSDSGSLSVSISGGTLINRDSGAFSCGIYQAGSSGSYVSFGGGEIIVENGVGIRVQNGTLSIENDFQPKISAGGSSTDKLGNSEQPLEAGTPIVLELMNSEAQISYYLDNTLLENAQFQPTAYSFDNRALKKVNGTYDEMTWHYFGDLSPYIITFDYNGFPNPPQVTAVTDSNGAVTPFTKFPEKPEWEEHVFRGWSKFKFEYTDRSNSITEAMMNTVSIGDTLDKDTTLYAIWTKKGEYLITFSWYDYVSFGLTENNGVLPEADWPKPPEGCADGWYPSTHGTESAYEKGCKFTEDTTVFAREMTGTAPYVITFIFDDGSDSVTQTTNDAGKLENWPRTPLDNDRFFIGWYTESSGGSRIAADHQFEGNTTAYAQWIDEDTVREEGRFVITFDYNSSNDGSSGSGSVKLITNRNLKPMFLPYDVPVREGYTFVGWFTARDDGEEVTVDTEFTGDKTVYAHWTENPGQTYTLTVTNGTGSGEYAEGTEVTITANDAPDGKAFDQWTTSSGGTFANAASATTTFTMPANDVTVTATYKDGSPAPEQTYTLTVTGGTGGGEYVAGAEVTITANDAPDGKAFDQWTTSSGGTFANAASATTTFTMPANDVTVTATYKDDSPAPEQTYTLTVTGGTGGGEYAEGAEVTITANDAPDGKVFDQWTTSSGGTFANAASATTTFTMPANDVTVSAGYKDAAAAPGQTAYMIYFDPNGGTVDIASMATGTDGRLPSLPIPRYNGYVFSGWYTAPIGGSFISANTVFTGNTVVYAHWVFDTNISDNRSSSLTEYAVVTPSTIGGTVTASRNFAAEGVTITVTVTPDIGYEMTSLIARDSWWNELELTDRGGGRYTLTMPNKAVTVNAAFTPVAWQPGPMVRPSRIWPYPGFTDVFAGAWYYDAVRFVCETGLMKGLSSAAFSPDAYLSRAQLTQILYNIAGSPAAGSVSGFADVTSGDWYAGAVAWAVSRNLIDGYDGGTFGPYDDVTREEIVTMLWRYAGKPASERELYFSDAADISTYALTAVRWAVEKGILNGNSDGALTPKGLATRAQVAQMLKNYFNA